MWDYGSLPEGWAVKKIGEYSTIITDYVANGSFASLAKNVEYRATPDYAVLIRLTDFNNGFNGNYVYIDKHAYDFLAKSKLFGGEIIISNVGANVGTVFRCPYLDIRMSLAPNAIMLKTQGNDDFYYYWFLSRNGQHSLKSIVTGSAQPKFNKTNFRDILVPVPPSTVQCKIAEYLGNIDKKIELNKQINENLLQQLSEIYHSWYVDFGTATEGYISSEYGEIPIGWHYEQLGDVCQSVSVTHKFDKEQLVFLNTGDVANGQFLHSNYMPVSDMPGQAKKTICPDDILYSEIRPANKHFAYVNFPSEDYVVSTKLMVIRSKGIDSRRLYHFLTMKETLTELQLQAESRSGTFPQIRFDNVSRLPILIADAETESTFTSILHSVYCQIESNIAENYKLAQIRDSLLPKFMSGELDVTELDI